MWTGKCRQAPITHVARSHKTNPTFQAAKCRYASERNEILRTTDSSLVSVARIIAGRHSGQELVESGGQHTFSAAVSATRRTPVVDSATRLKANPGDSPPVRPALWSV